jgi:hypothetical protein
MRVKLEVRTEMHVGLHVKYLLLLLSNFLPKSEWVDIIVEFPNITFHANLQQVLSCMPTDR